MAVVNDAQLPPLSPETLLHRELWSSWAGVLRAYAAVHSLGKPQHPIIEVSDHEILVRYGTQWMRFSPALLETNTGQQMPFRLTENGTVIINDTEDEMDLAAERLTREIISM